VNRIGAIVESVAAFAENHQVPFGPVDLREVLRSVAEISADECRKLGVALTWPTEQAVVVQGNFGQLVQVFLNLVLNAVHALEDRPAPAIAVTWRTGEGGTGRWLRVEIEDNGRGIDPQVLPRVFDPFFTTKATGTNGARRGMGLGLAIVKRIIDGHRGQIGVDSQPGKGTRFTVLLPVPDSIPTSVP
jgi:signal transduction histidine kinase